VIGDGASSVSMEVVNESSPKLELQVLRVSKSSQLGNGLKHGDYRRYRQYCTNRLHRIRKSIRFTCGRGKFQKRPLANALMNKNAGSKALLLPLFHAERCWSFGMELKDLESGRTSNKARRAVIRKLKKAVVYAEQLHEMCSNDIVEDRTVLESEAYLAWMKANLYLEQEDWHQSLEYFLRAKQLYEAIADALGVGHASVFASRLEEIGPSIRFCNYNLQRNQSDKPELIQLLGETGAARDLLSAKIDAALAESRKTLAQSFGSVSWCGREVAIRSEEVREAVLAAKDEQNALEQELQSSALIDASPEKKAACYDKVFIAYNEAARLVKSQLKASNEDELMRLSEDRIAEVEDLYAFVTFTRLSLTVDRNLLLVQSLHTKSAKPEDFVRLFDTLLQTVREMMELRGISDDTIATRTLEFESEGFRVNRCFHMARLYLDLKRFREACALFDHAYNLADTAISANGGAGGTRITAAEMKSLQGSCKRMKMRALSLEWSEITGLSKDVKARLDVKANGTVPKPLIDSLNETTGSTVLVQIPPLLQPVPCRPLVFDLAVDGIEFPKYETVIDVLDAANKKSTPAKVSEKAVDSKKKPTESASTEKEALEPKKSFLSRLWGGK